MGKRNRKRGKQKPPRDSGEPPSVEYDWTKKCSVCGQSPVFGDLGMCGPCTTGEADTLTP